MRKAEGAAVPAAGGGGGGRLRIWFAHWVRAYGSQHVRDREARQGKAWHVETPAGHVEHLSKRRELLLRGSRAAGDMRGKDFRRTQQERDSFDKNVYKQLKRENTAKKRQHSVDADMRATAGQLKRHSTTKRHRRARLWRRVVPPPERRHRHLPRSPHVVDANTISGTYRGYRGLTTETRPVRRCSGEWCCRSWTKRR